MEPYGLNALSQVVIDDQFSTDSLVWKNGMAKWEKAENIDELKVLFGNMPPVLQQG